MANVLNRSTLKYLESVNTPDYPVENWVINPDMSGVASVPQKYWKLIGDVPSEMSTEEKQLVDQANLPNQIKAVVNNAMNFGSNLIFEFATENVLLGITQLGLTSHVRRTCVEVVSALTTGSLYDAIDEIKKISPDSLDANILTPERVLVFRNKIEQQLGIPLATVWNEGADV